MNKIKRALITGAAKGIGAETARYLAEAGYEVCINYCGSEDQAQQLQQELSERGSKAIVVQADLSLEADVERLFRTMDEQLGPVTALVNNAALMRPQSRLEDMTAARVTEMLVSNVCSVFMCCREAVKRMSTRHGGSGGAIVNVSSGAAISGSPNEYTDYAASKGALDTFTRGLAKEVAAEGIRVNAVRPGFIDTDIHADGGEPDRMNRVKDLIPMKRNGEVHEIAGAIRWLLSDEASFTTGAFIDITGGS